MKGLISILDITPSPDGQSAAIGYLEKWESKA
jgi:hypothetical protein